MLYIDYSAKQTFEFCAWAWYERYVNKRQARRREGQRDDALTLGSLVHAGLEDWYRRRVCPEISPEAIAKFDPTPECLGEAKRLLEAYTIYYPNDPYKVLLLEKPLSFDLFPWCRVVAKVDTAVEVEQGMRVPGGLNEEGLELEPGIYSLEHKTKDAEIDRGMYMASWQTNMQADFQMLVMQAKFPERPIRGVIVNVLEKPRPYVPKRTCKNCKIVLEMAAFIATSEGHCCPMCGVEQKLSVSKGPRVERKYECWRFLVTRTSERLERSLNEIRGTATTMSGMISMGMDTASPNRSNCCIPRFKKKCEYFTPHLYNVSTESSDFEDTEDYVGEGMVGWQDD